MSKFTLKWRPWTYPLSELATLQPADRQLINTHPSSTNAYELMRGFRRESVLFVTSSLKCGACQGQ